MKGVKYMSKFSRAELEAYWMPYTGNRQFKDDPRMIAGADGAYLIDDRGRRIFDGLSGLWTTGLGHCRPEISDAIANQTRKLDFAPSFQFGHDGAFELANRLKDLAPEDLNYVFYTNSGSDGADTSTKIARAYWRQRGQPAKTRIIGRAKGYHGASWGAISFGGIGANRKLWGQAMEADHLNHTQVATDLFTRGMSKTGGELAEELHEIVALHDASNIAAVIVEPFSGSGGVIIPPEGYLKRLRDICTQYDILLIFDEVITAFGRAGSMFGAIEFGVTPDMMTIAKQLTNGAVPMGAVIVREGIYQTFMDTGGPDYMLELPHGYTYSGHPLSCAAALATLDIIEQEQIVGRVKSMSPYFEEAVHSLKGAKHVGDIRNYGFAAGISLNHIPGEPARRPFEIAQRMWEKGFFVRYGGDNLQIGIPFISEKHEIDSFFNALDEEINRQD